MFCPIDSPYCPLQDAWRLHRDVVSDAAIDEVVADIAATNVTQRGKTRADERVTEAAMEDRKRVGLLLSASDQAVAR